MGVEMRGRTVKPWSALRGVSYGHGNKQDGHGIGLRIEDQVLAHDLRIG